MGQVEFAREYGRKMHAGQVRKYTGEPYFEHCEAVEELVNRFFELGLREVCPDEIRIAALLHDVVEDTEATIEDVERLFGEEVATLVWYLTKPYVNAGSRSHRKALYGFQMSMAPEDAQIVKYFDMAHNITSIEKHDPDFWELFQIESIQMLKEIKAYNIRDGKLLAYKKFV